MSGNYNQRVMLMEACVKGINDEVIKITDRIRKIESTIDHWEKTREPMIFNEPDRVLISEMDADARMMERRVSELKKEKELIQNEMPDLFS